MVVKLLGFLVAPSVYSLGRCSSWVPNKGLSPALSILFVGGIFMIYSGTSISGVSSRESVISGGVGDNVCNFTTSISGEIPLNGTGGGGGGN